MEFKIVNLKEFSPTAEQAIAELEIELEIARKSNVKAIKFIHGYGSHGKGGAISLAVRRHAAWLLRNKKIKFYLSGSEWDLQNERTREIIFACKNLYGDEDLGHANPGITIIGIV